MLANARRGLAKPSSHGRYLAMDLEPIAPREAITGAIGIRRGGVGAIVFEFGREMAAAIARREEYDAGKFGELIALADRARKPLGEFLLEIARRTRFDLLGYRSELRSILGYTSPGYIFHPLPLSDGRAAIVAIGSGYEGSGDPQLRSRRQEYGIDRILGLDEALRLSTMEVDREGQLGYFAECTLGGVHGIPVADLTAGVDLATDTGREVARLFRAAAAGERERFLSATSLGIDRYLERFGGAPEPGVGVRASAVDSARASEILDTQRTKLWRWPRPRSLEREGQLRGEGKEAKAARDNDALLPLG